MSRKLPPARPPTLRVVEGDLDPPADDDTSAVVPCMDANVVLQRMVVNLRADAGRVAEELSSWAAKWCRGLGAEVITADQSAQISKMAFDAVMELHHTRLLMGLLNSIDRLNGVDTPDEQLLPETPQGLMARFRAALAEDDEEQS